MISLHISISASLFPDENVSQLSSNKLFGVVGLAKVEVVDVAIPATETDEQIIYK